jgi:arylformamidase
MKSLFAVFLLTSSVVAAEPRAYRDVAYAEPKNERQTLDVYAPAEKGKDRPVVVWIHGGGWRAGDKRDVQKKPEAFVEKGFVFVSTNYRFVPKATVKEMTADIAKAIRWVHDHAKEFGGDPNSIFVMGHSAGAHLAALVCTDDRYLKAEGLSLAMIKGCVPVDTAVYDVAKQIESVAPTQAARAASYRSTFGDSQSQKELSPVTYVAKGKNIPPFLILHVADRPDSGAQSRTLAETLEGAGVSAKVVAAEGKDHGTINSELGLAEDGPTKALWEFVDGVLKKSSVEEEDGGEEGFASLFNGTDLTGWEYGPVPVTKKPISEKLEGKPATSDGVFSVRDGMIVASGKRIMALYTAQQFNKDFQFKLEFRVGTEKPKDNSGIYIRGPQLQLDAVTEGGLTGVFKKLTKFKPGDWNEIEITVTGTEAICKCNGEMIGKPMTVPEMGTIGLQSEYGAFEFRKIEIKEGK